MATKESEKINEIPKLENAVSNILVINQAKLKPYIELFHYTPENITLSPLGEMLGFFQISDLSEDSAYIVNFLTSVIKKEYYANPKRSISTSMDAALHRVNLALAETAKHGNINWVGKINAAVCVLEKNNLHFSVTGNARILLIRKQSVIDISEDFSENKDPSPLKTFADVSSGRLEANDKIIISTEELFNLFSLTELKKASYRFAPEKFTQFIRTALINETELAGTFIIDLSEKKPEDSAKSAIKKAQKNSLNAFSGKAFQPANIPPSIEKNISLKENSENYTDKKTGHIYIQEQQISPEESSSSSQYALVFKEKIGDFSYWAKKQSRRSLLKIKSAFKSLRERIITLKKERALEKERTAEAAYIKEIKTAELNIQEKPSSPVPQKAPPVVTKKEAPIEIQETPPQLQPIAEKIRPLLVSSKNFGITTYDRFKNIAVSIAKFSKEKLSSLPLRKIIPSFSKIRRLFHMFSYQQKIYAILAVILIVIGPLVYLKIKKDRNAAIEQSKKESIATIQEVPAVKKSVLESTSFSEIGSVSEGKYIFTTKEGLAVVGEKSIFTLENGAIKNNQFSENIKPVRTATYMKDLDLVFVVTENNKIFSFSPVTHSFVENSIIIPPESKIVGAGTYLTYLYLIDGSTNQIYRYPRAEGGFGVKSDWLKGAPDNLSSTLSTALDENIYLVTKTEISKFFKGKKESFNLGATTPPLSITSIYTTLDGTSIYILDQENSRIAVFQKDGSFLKNYANEILSNATNIVADETNKKLYAVTKEKIISFEMN